MLIEASTIKALLLAAAKKDTRFYLQGIHFEVKNEVLIMVATDGHRLMVVKQAVPGEADDSFIVPRDALEKLASKGELDISHVDGKITIAQGNTSSTCLAVVAKYPDWRRVVPRGRMSGEHCSFNPSYLLDAEKAGILLGRKKYWLEWTPNGENTIININPSAFILIMATRGDKDSDLGAPEWI